MFSLGLIQICLRFADRGESRFYKDLVLILENLQIRRYVSVSRPRLPHTQQLTISVSCLVASAT
jgi:hypothetical protein